MEAAAVSHQQVIDKLKNVMSDICDCAVKCDNLTEKGKWLRLAATCEKEIERIEQHQRELHRQFLRFLLAGFAKERTAS